MAKPTRDELSVWEINDLVARPSVESIMTA
jgi:hypothetical protein